MATYILRLWLPDRPGALGAVASRVGAVGGDVIGINILERGDYRAIDELVIELHDDDWIGLLLTEVAEVDGVDIEHVSPAVSVIGDPRLEALEAAAALVSAPSVDAAIDELCRHATRQLSAAWGAVVSPDVQAVLTSSGHDPRTEEWLIGLCNSVLSAPPRSPRRGIPDDVVWAPLLESGLALVLGREGLPFRSRERRQAGVMASIVDLRFSESGPHSFDASRGRSRSTPG